MPVPDKATRDANLDVLKSSADEYISSEITRLDNETKFLRAVLAGRGGNAAAALNLQAAATLIQTEVDEFLLLSV